MSVRSFPRNEEKMVDSYDAHDLVPGDTFRMFDGDRAVVDEMVFGGIFATWLSGDENRSGDDLIRWADLEGQICEVNGFDVSEHGPEWLKSATRRSQMSNERARRG